MPTLVQPTFSIVQGSWDNWARPYRMPWDELAERLTDHRQGDKDGTALICATFNGTRSNELLHERHLVALDIEQKKLLPTEPQVLAQILALKGLASVVWTTWSHEPERPRYRVLLPLDKPVKPLAHLGDDLKGSMVVDRLLPALVAANLGLNGMVDEGKYGASSLFYLPRHRAGATHFATAVDGDALRVHELVPAALAYHIGYRMRSAQLEALHHSTEFPAELRQLIEAYNEGHELTDLFPRYKYERHGNRYKSPYQARSSQAATAIFDDHLGWYSWSESDKAAGLGRSCSDGIVGDAFSLFQHFEHGNNFREAIAALGGRHD